MTDLPAIRRALLATRESLICRAAGQPEPEPPGDDANHATANLAREQVALDHERVRARVLAIDAALARMDAGVYGICIDCRDGIPERRLTEHPTAARCVACEGAQERRMATRRPVANDEDGC